MNVLHIIPLPSENISKNAGFYGKKIKQINQKPHQNHCFLAEITIFTVYIYMTPQELLLGDKGEMFTCL